MSLIDPSLASQFDRLPPRSIEAEQCLLGSMMLDQRCVPEVLETIDREAFYSADNQIIFDMLLKLWRAGKPVDAILLREELLKRGLLEEVGGAAYLGQILSSVPTAANALNYAAIVFEKYQLRQAIAIANDILRDAYGHTPVDRPAELLGGYAARLATALASRATGVITIGEAAQKAYEQLDAVDSPLQPFGFRDIDYLYGGIMAGENVLIAARPSMGKSTLARQLAVRMARAGCPVGYVSLEESHAKLARNMLSDLAEVENNRLRRGRDFIKREEWSRLADGVRSLNSFPGGGGIFVDDKAFRMPQIRAAATRMKARYGIKVLFIDYMQKIQIEGKGRYEKVTNASLEISTMLKELDLAGVTLAQLNRQNLGRSDHRPDMGDLRESGQIEQDADGIVFLHREDYYRASDANYTPTRRAELIFAKWRDGVRGVTIELETDMAYQRFRDAAPQLGVEQQPFPEGL